MYWSEYFDGTIQRANLDGSGIETIIDSGVAYVWQTAVLVPEPSTLPLLTMGALGLLAFAWRRRRR